MNENWWEQVDFAWVGSDQGERLALFYIDAPRALPDYLSKYDLQSYNCLTAFIIDELDSISDTSGLNATIRSDVERGFYVYNFDSSKQVYRRVGCPTRPIMAKALAEYRNLIITMPDVAFPDASALRPPQR